MRSSAMAGRRTSSRPRTRSRDWDARIEAIREDHRNALARCRDVQLLLAHPSLSDAHRLHLEEELRDARSNAQTLSAEEVKYLRRLPVTVLRRRVLRSIPRHHVDVATPQGQPRRARPRGHRSRAAKRATCTSSGSSGSDEPHPGRGRRQPVGAHLFGGVA